MAAINRYTDNTTPANPVVSPAKQSLPPAKTADSQSVLKRYIYFRSVVFDLIRTRLRIDRGSVRVQSPPLFCDIRPLLNFTLDESVLGFRI